jgi:hypothetical protein
MLPEMNEIPMTTYEAQQNVCTLGLEVERIHACKNDCVMFSGDDYKNLTECLECGFLRKNEDLMVLMKRGNMELPASWRGISQYNNT